MISKHSLATGFTIVVCVLLSAILVSSCGNDDLINRGDVTLAIEKTLSEPGPVRDELIEKGLVLPASVNGTSPVPGELKIGEIQQLIEDGTYEIDEDGYLQFGPSH